MDLYIPNAIWWMFCKWRKSCHFYLHLKKKFLRWPDSETSDGNSENYNCDHVGGSQKSSVNVRHFMLLPSIADLSKFTAGAISLATRTKHWITCASSTVSSVVVTVPFLSGAKHICTQLAFYDRSQYSLLVKPSKKIVALEFVTD